MLAGGTPVLLSPCHLLITHFCGTKCHIKCHFIHIYAFLPFLHPSFPRAQVREEMEHCEKITQPFPNQSYSVLTLNPTYSLLWPTYYPFNPTTCSDLESIWHYPTMASFLLVGEPWALSVACTEPQSCHRTQSSWNKQSSTGLGFYWS